jgi:hypothetical protein
VKAFSRTQRIGSLWICGVLLSGGSLACVPVNAQESNDSASTPSDQPSPAAKKPAEQRTVRLRIEVKGDNGKPVANASVYVRYNIPGGLLHSDKLAELDLKTNGDGSVKVPAVPQGRILVQVIAPGWHTYGKWYDIVDKDEESIEIKLDPPHRWY